MITSKVLTRWLAALLLIGLVLSVQLVQRPAQAAPSGQRLRALAGNFLIGYASANDFWTLPDTTTYQDTARSEFNMLTPENQLKWDTIHPQQNTFNFAPGDQHIQFARANGMVAHGHTLVWHNQLPSWLTGGSWTASTLTSVLNNHIDTVVGHYRGQIAIWDVVNEAFNDNGTYRTSLWFNTIGQSYIEQAFRRARAADPNAVLLYNDYNIETLGTKSDAVFAMAQDFKNRGVPIDGIGLQMHLTSGGINLSSLVSNMQRFANLGLSIYITEMDVRLTTPPSASDLSNQATIYQNVLDRCLLQPACKALQVWGVTDKYSWVPSTFPGQGAALIFDENYNAKPAYFALQSRLGGGGPTPTPTRTPSPTIGPSPTPTRIPTATPTPPPGATCQVTYTIVNQWVPGFQASVDIKNTGTSTINNWTLGWAFPNGQTIYQLWNGNYTQNGANVSVTNLSWNAAIAPGATVNVGFNANWSGTNTKPTAFTLNGVSCAVAP